MAIYRNVQMTFWTDPDVVDEYTPDDKLFYLYALTNPHTNLCGCYEISVTQLANEIGYDKKKTERLLDRAINIHGTIAYSWQTKELMVINWWKYNWTKSEKFRKPLFVEISSIKDDGFRDYLTSIYNGDTDSVYCIDTVSSSTGYGIDTTVTVTDTVTVSDTVTDTDKVRENKYYPNDDKLDQAFSDYVDMRKKIKSPMTDRAITLAMNKLKELAAIPFSDMMDNDLAIEILNQSVMNNWKGLFPLKDDTQSRTQRMAQEVDSWTRQSSGNS